jgi:hypothetical protein
MPRRLSAWLAEALVEKGDFAGGLKILRQGQALLPPLDGRHAALRQLIEVAERYQKVDAKLPAILTGKEKPADALEQAMVALICARKERRHAAAARFFAAAFAAQPGLGEDVSQGTRYVAACSAIVAGTGQAKDGTDLDAAERSRWRNQALAWLQADLAMWSKQLDSGGRQARAMVRVMLSRWQKEPDLAGVGDPKMRLSLPAEEREAWQRLWDDVEALLSKAIDVPPHWHVKPLLLTGESK